MSGLVESDYGYHIIKCTDEFTPPEQITSIDQLPQEFADTYRESVKQQDQQEAYQAWFDEFKEGADIVINDMPAGLPYAVDMSQYQTEDESSDEAAADASSDEATSDDSASGESADQAAESGDAASEAESGDAGDAAQTAEAA